MHLALAEIRRAKTRFGLLIAAIGLLVFLILFQQSVQYGLVTSFVGAIRNQSAPVLVYSVDGQRVIQASTITPDLEALLRSADGVGRTGRIGQGTFTVTTGGAAPQRHDTAIFGHDDPALGAPGSLVAGRFPQAAGEAIASDADAGDGFDVGQTVVVEPGGATITVVGLARDVRLNAGPTLFVDYATYLDAVDAANPDAGTPLPNVIAIRPAPGVTAQEVVAAVNATSTDLDALTRERAADVTPGVAQVRASFRIIFLLYGLVVPCVTGLFFLIVTFQKARSLTLLHAIGAPARRLVGALLVQVVMILIAGFALGVALYAPVSQRRLGGIPLRFETGAVILWAIVLLGLGVVSSALAARRVLAIDPVEATLGGGTR